VLDADAERGRFRLGLRGVALKARPDVGDDGRDRGRADSDRTVAVSLIGAT
jgi:hypothetical protein